MSKTTEAVFQYFRSQNRPYSVNDVVQNLKEHGKGAIQKAVDQLVLDGKIKEKTYGKQKVYVIDQSQVESAENANTGEIINEIGQLTREIAEDEAALNRAESELKIISSSLTTEEIKSQLSKLKEENSKLQAKLNGYSQKRAPVSASDVTKVRQMKDKTVSEWRKRKRMCCDMLDAILEGYPKGKKALYEEVGIEVDDVKIPD